MNIKVNTMHKALVNNLVGLYKKQGPCGWGPVEMTRVALQTIFGLATGT